MKIKTFIKLGDICDISAGQGAPQGDSNYCDNGTPFVKAGNLIELLQGKNETDIQKVSEDVAKKHKLKKYTAGSILFAKSGMSCMKGYVYQLKNDSYVVSHLAIVKPIKDSSDYIEYCLRHIKPNSLVKDEAYPSISLQDISNLKIPLPSLEEQIKISKQLYICTQIINKHKKQLEKYDTLIKSRFIEMFGDPVLNPMGWEEVRITELCKNPDDIKCGPFGTQLSKDEYQKKGVPIFGIPQINSSFRVLPTDFLTNSKAEKLDAYSLIYGDIAMSRKGNVGKCAIYSGKEKGIIHSDVVRLRVDDAICNSIYLMNQLHINQKVETQISNVSSGAIMAGINVTKMKDIIVYNPPLSLQNDFASFVQQIDKSKFEIANSLKRLYNKGMLS